MSARNAEVDAAVERLQLRYIDALDGKDMNAWLETFCTEPSASYVCTTAESVNAGRSIAYILDDCHARLMDRVTFITKIWAGTFQDYQPRHMTQRISLKQLTENELEMRSNFSVLITPSDTGRVDTLIAGRYLDRVRLAGGEASFLSRKAVTDNSILPRYLVYPL